MRLQKRSGAIATAVLLAGIGGAGAAGVGEVCGPILNGDCPPGLFCNHKAGTCNLLGAIGTCVAVSKVCPRIWRPVCGCNGKTYANDCERLSATVQAAHDGVCK